MIPANFRSTLRYQSKGEPASLLADLDALQHRSAAARGRRSGLILGLILSIVAGVGFTVGTGKADIGLLLPLTGAVLGVGCAGTMIVLLVRNNRMILDDRRGKLAGSVVRCLGCDLPPGGKIEVEVDFNGYHDAKYRTKQWALPTYAATAYRLPWLVVAATLIDGSRIQLAADLVAQRKERSKTKGRKKVKEDLCEHVTLTLRVRALPPAATARWPELVRTRPMPPGAIVHRAGVKEDRLTVEVRTQRQVRVTNKGTVTSGHDIEKNLASQHTLLAAMLAAYQALHACRAG